MDIDAAGHRDAFQGLCRRVNLILAFDHGRAGNGFLAAIFDQHPQVLCSHWVHYLYSYLVTEFGMDTELDAERACAFILEKSYFRLVFQDADARVRAMLYKMGGDPDTPVDRETARRVFRDLVTARPRVSRRELVVAAYYAMAIGAGRDVSQARYLMVADAVSLRTEHVMRGFSGRVLDAALADFPQLRPISLVRDPRAMFASCRHQYVNVLGNMYAVAPGSFTTQLARLARDDLHMDTTVWSFWLAYRAQSARCISRMRGRAGLDFRVLRNEDLNLHFEETMRLVSGWLGIDMLPDWTRPDFTPTSMGRPWKGTGAYNSRYQSKTSGPLTNDPQTVADRSAGPNRHVTERWRSRLAGHEIRLVERLFAEEMRDLGYEPMEAGAVPAFSLAGCLMRPLRGELPGLSWIVRGFRESVREGLRRLCYPFFLPPFYVVSRWRFYRLIRSGLFENILEGGETAKKTPFLSPVHRGSGPCDAA